LLDATIDALAQEGYANTTTRGIAARAGMTPGALQHHFATKTELLGEARLHISTKIAQAMLAQGSLTALPMPQRSEQLIDRMWELFKGPLFQAGMELWVAARTDTELRGKLVEVQRTGGQWIAAAGRINYPELADRTGLAELHATIEAALRGLAILSFVNAADADRTWPATRAYMLAVAAQFAAEAETSQ
jgi:AcrR family transcriptional regulator